MDTDLEKTILQTNMKRLIDDCAILNRLISITDFSLGIDDKSRACNLLDNIQCILDQMDTTTSTMINILID